MISRSRSPDAHEPWSGQGHALLDAPRGSVLCNPAASLRDVAVGPPSTIEVQEDKGSLALTLTDHLTTDR